VTTTDNAKRLGLKKYVHPLSYSEMVNFNPHDPLPDVTETGFGVAGPEALQKAGMQPSDIDMFQPYDDFLIAVLMQLEQIGFCKRGEGSKFLMETDVSYRGSFPINSGGGQISAGQPAVCGSGVMVTEALRQLFQDGGERQVKKARTAMCTGIGIIRHYHNWGTSNVMILEANNG
jgi:acetyl-CoA acetyltransferase